MPLPSLKVMGIATADPALFEGLMAAAGFRITRRHHDPLGSHVQEEAVTAIASAITEDTYYGVRLSPYHRKLKTLAEQAGYLVENCGPEGEDPCEGELESPEVETMGGPDVASRELDQLSQLPLGTELAAEIMRVIKGEGVDALDDEGLHGEMPMGGEEMIPIAEVGEGEAIIATSEEDPTTMEEDPEEGRPY